MGILERFEQRVDRLVSGAFARAFEAEVQPVEVAAALQRETDDRARAIGAGRTVVPNFFVVDLSPVDFERLTAHADTLSAELVGLLREHITDQRYTTLGHVQVSFDIDHELTTGIFRVNAEAREDAAHPTAAPVSSTRRGPHVVINGFVHPLTKQHTVIGRGTDADIRLDDSGISRRHCEVVLSSPILLRDLNSTNGTWVRGERISELTLTEDTDIVLGEAVVQFRIR